MVVCLKDCTIGISESERRADQIISTISLLSFVVCYVAVLDCSTKCLFSHFFPFIRQLSRSRTSAYTWNKIISFSFVCCSFRFIFVWMKECHLNRIWNRWIECVDLGHFATILNNTLCVVQCACLMFFFLHRRKGRTTSAEPFLYINITSFPSKSPTVAASFFLRTRSLRYKLLWLENEVKKENQQIFVVEEIFSN